MDKYFILLLLYTLTKTFVNSFPATEEELRKVIYGNTCNFPPRYFSIEEKYEVLFGPCSKPEGALAKICSTIRAESNLCDLPVISRISDLTLELNNMTSVTSELCLKMPASLWTVNDNCEKTCTSSSFICKLYVAMDNVLRRLLENELQDYTHIDEFVHSGKLKFLIPYPPVGSLHNHAVLEKCLSPTEDRTVQLLCTVMAEVALKYVSCKVNVEFHENEVVTNVSSYWNPCSGISAFANFSTSDGFTLLQRNCAELCEKQMGICKMVYLGLEKYHKATAVSTTEVGVDPGQQPAAAVDAQVQNPQQSIATGFNQGQPAQQQTVADVNQGQSEPSQQPAATGSNLEQNPAAAGSNQGQNLQQQAATGSNQGQNSQQQAAPGSNQGQNPQLQAATGSNQGQNPQQQAATGSNQGQNPQLQTAPGFNQGQPAQQSAIAGVNQGQSEPSQQPDGTGLNQGQNPKQQTSTGFKLVQPPLQPTSAGGNEGQPEQQPVATADSQGQQPPPSATGDGQGLLPSGTGDGQSLLPSGTGNGQGLLPSGTGNGQGLLQSGTGNGQGLLPSGTGNGQGLLPSGTGNGQVLLPSGTGNGQGLLPNATGNGQILLPSGTGNGQGLLPNATGAGQQQGSEHTQNGSSTSTGSTTSTDKDFVNADQKKLEQTKENTAVYTGAAVDDDGSSGGHFMAYFLVFIVLSIAGYIIFHNKQKIIALVIEGKTGKGSRRPNTKDYKQVKTEDVMPSLEKSAYSKDYVF